MVKKEEIYQCSQKGKMKNANILEMANHSVDQREFGTRL